MAHIYILPNSTASSLSGESTIDKNKASVAMDAKLDKMRTLPSTDTFEEFLKMSINKMENERTNTPANLLTWFIQVIGLSAAVAFGIFSALSWSGTNAQTNLARSQATAAQLQVAAAHSQAVAAHSQAAEAHLQADTANLLALAALCAPLLRPNTIVDAAMRSLCDSFYANAIPSLASAASALVPSITIPATSSSGIASISSSPIASGSSSVFATIISTQVSASSTSLSLKTVTTVSITGSPTFASTVTSSISSISGSPTSVYSGSRQAGGLNTEGKIALGLALSLGFLVIVVTVLSVLARRHQRRKQQAAYQALGIHTEAT